MVLSYQDDCSLALRRFVSEEIGIFDHPDISS
jgi:hypothetical protein